MRDWQRAEKIIGIKLGLFKIFVGNQARVAEERDYFGHDGVIQICRNSIFM
jgi:hypothetical protein